MAVAVGRLERRVDSGVEGDQADSVAVIYGCNVIGGALGALACGFVLIWWFGITGTAWFALILLFILGGIAILLSRGLPESAREAEEMREAERRRAIDEAVAAEAAREAEAAAAAADEAARFESEARSAAEASWLARSDLPVGVSLLALARPA